MSLQPLRIIQHNCAKNKQIQETLLDIANGTADIILLQEIHLYPQGTTVPSPSFDLFIPDTTNHQKPRTAIYVNKSRTDIFCSLRSDLLPVIDGDTTLLQILAGQETFYIYNVYNERRKLSDNSNPYTIDRYLCSLKLNGNSILAGDFNAHHPWWNSEATPTRTEKLLPFLTDNHMDLVNIPDVPTYHHRQNTGDSVIDLVFATDNISDRVLDWAVDDTTHTGSDHEILRYTLLIDTNNTVPSPLSQRYNWQKADWSAFKDRLLTNSNREQAEFYSLLTIASPTTLDKAAVIFTDWIVDALKESVPFSRPCSKSKRWWTEELTTLRKQMSRNCRNWKRDQCSSTRLTYKASRNTYFNAIQTTKTSHWRNYLETLEGTDIWQAMRYTKPSRQFKTPSLQHNQTTASEFHQKCNLFRKILFPTPPTVNKPYSVREGRGTDEIPWIPVTAEEVKKAIMTSASNKAPGPDGINFLCLKQVLDILPQHLLDLYSTLIETGYHPHCWREATGAILKKANKPDYTAPKAYRPVSLLNCLGKVAEKIVAKRFSTLAEKYQLLDTEQMGGRPGRSVVDAVLALTHDIETGNKLGKVVSVLFLDVKGAFDHVNREQLLEVLQDLGFPTPVLSWVDSFLTDRLIALAFDGQKEDLHPVATGIPQGSPVSPILFLFYLTNLFTDLKDSISLQDKLSTPSYVDDCALVITGPSESYNAMYLRMAAKIAFQWAENNFVQFDDLKIDLMHFHKKPSTYTTNTPVKITDTNIIHPSGVLRWLGVWLDRKLSFNHHVQTRIASAKRTLSAIQRLASSEWGLSAAGMRKLYVSCIVPIAYFGAEAWWKHQVGFADQLQKLQSAANRRILGAFKTSPIACLDKEASNLPPNIRLDHMCRRYAYRVLRMPYTHPVRQRAPSSFPSIHEFQTNGQDPIHNTQLTTVLETLSSNIESKTIPEDGLPFLKATIDKKTEAAWVEYWNSLPDDRKGSHYLPIHSSPPTTKVSPHLHQLTKLQVSTITQLKISHGYFNSYLVRQQPDLSPICNKCQLNQPETPEHIILHCEKYQRWRRELGSRSMEDLVGTKEGLEALGNFIRRSGAGTRRRHLGEDWVAV
jgi:hypothetical protein